MAGQLLLINPRRRRKSRKSRARRRGRKMSALQMKYFGGGRARSNPKRRRRSSARRSRARSYARRARRSFRSVGRSMGFSLPSITAAAKTATIGAAGAVAVDVLMGQANRFLPADWQSRTDAATGGINWKYYVAKGALAIGLGVAGARFGGRYRGAVLTMAQGSLMVQAYEVLREVIPQDFLPLGYYTSGAVQIPGMPANAPGMAGVGKYLPRNVTPMNGLRGMRGLAQSRYNQRVR